ncbi:helix-turn-helix domain-containing protein [Belliella sp. DSM 111904]|uniref:Helix-turn-helix domain-containing protein n=1 Tax=Belliella filtrata TaxID=2923435 RepID=A0ABS9UYY3_9BACT|nr:helix-turn-helix transcriptional regulator [Belliella filtrata]MCH7408968.1 helix-turn-helix domain-containing protein [Belliella filtrata]
MAKRKKELTDKENDLLKAIGAELEKLRKNSGYTNYENFAFEKGINRSQYGKYEAGNVDIQITTLLKILGKFDGMTLQQFFKNIDY